MSKPVALFDLDGTLADFDGALARDLQSITSPFENLKVQEIANQDDRNDPPWLKARKSLIKKQPNWWFNLQPLPLGFKVLELARKVGFRIVICSRGPKHNADAWAQKVLWVQKYITGPHKIILADEKNLVYGRVLVDDWPDYVTPWLNARPRGNVIMPAHRWNENYTHERVVKLATEADLPAIRIMLESQVNRNSK